MTKTKLGLFAIPFIATIMISAGISAQLVSAEPALVIKDGACTMLDGDGNFIAATDVHQVKTNSNKDNSKIWCSASGVDNSSGKAVKFQGTDRNDNKHATTLAISCSTGFASTNNWTNNISASGEAKLVCHFKN